MKSYLARTSVTRMLKAEIRRLAAAAAREDGLSGRHRPASSGMAAGRGGMAATQPTMGPP